MNFRAKLIFILSLIFLFFSCSLFDIGPSFYKERRDSHKLFRCDFDGEEWTNSYDSRGFFLFGYSSKNLESTFFKDHKGKDYLEIYAKREGDDKGRIQSINIVFNDKLVLGKNYITINRNYIVLIKDDEKDIYDFYYLDLDFENYLDIESINIDNEIIKGTFQFSAETKDGKKRIKVLDGEIDLKIDCWRPISDHHEFTCYINKEKWEVEQYFTRKTEVPLAAWYDSEKNIFEINAENRELDGRFNLKFNYINGLGEIQLKQYDRPIFEYFHSNSIEYFLDSSSRNVVNITEFNSTKKFIKGTFDFKAIGGNGSWKDTITVKKGYFDSKYFKEK